MALSFENVVQLCIRAAEYPLDVLHNTRALGSGFLPSGIGVQVQDTVESVSANYIESGHGLQAVVPAERGNRLKIFFGALSGYVWHQGDVVTIRPAISDCSDPEWLPRVGAVGVLALGADGVLDAEGFGGALPGLYQVVCVRVCVCVCMRARARTCVCVCVCARVRVRTLSLPPSLPPSLSLSLSHTHTHTRTHVYVCVCVLDRESAREKDRGRQ